MSKAATSANRPSTASWATLAEIVTKPWLSERPTFVPALSALMVCVVAVLLISDTAPGDRTPATVCALSFQ